MNNEIIYQRFSDAGNATLVRLKRGPFRLQLEAFYLDGKRLSPDAELQQVAPELFPRTGSASQMSKIYSERKRRLTRRTSKPRELNERQAAKWLLREELGI